VDDASRESAAAGWYEHEATLRYWDGERWTDHFAPLSAAGESPENSTPALIWGLSLAFGVAGALAWDAPAIAYFWPLGLGGAGMALAIVGYSKGSEVPWFAVIAVIASIVAILLGVSGHSQLEDARNSLNELGNELGY
jgi:Protein of unknown function (DUF2510)